MLAKVSDTARLDADLLIGDACGLKRDLIELALSEQLGESPARRLNELLARRAKGEPVAYLIAHKEFWSLPIRTTAGALIPRPETELLVERMVHRCRGIEKPRIADLGTGTGAVALAVATELADSQVVATDNCEQALRVAECNRVNLGISNIQLIQCDWLNGLAERRFDVIGANPPYIKQDDPCLKDPALGFEPRAALVGGTDGLECLRQVVETAKSRLVHGGWLIVEHGWEQGRSVRDLMCANRYEMVMTECDLAGNERVTEGRKPAGAS